MSGCSTRGTPSTSANASRVTSSSVGPRPPVRITRSARSSARRRCSATSRRLSPTTVFDRSSIPSEARRSASRSEFVSSRVEPSSSLPIAMISAVCNICAPLTPPIPGRAPSRAAATGSRRLPPSHHRPSRPGRRAAPRVDRAGKGLITSKIRKRTKPMSAALTPTGMNASVISIPTTSSRTIGPGSMPPNWRSAIGAGPDAHAEEADDEQHLHDWHDRRPGPRKQAVNEQAHGRSDRAGRNRKVAGVAGRGEEDRESSHAFTTRVSARRSCSARPSESKRMAANPSPAGISETR